MYIQFHFGSDGVSSIVGRGTQNKRLSINGRGEKEKERGRGRDREDELPDGYELHSDAGRKSEREEKGEMRAERKSERPE